MSLGLKLKCTKIRVWALLFVLGFSLLGIQILLLTFKDYVGRNSDELRLKHIAKFLRIFSAHSIPLILLEPSILKILPTFDPRTKCHYFCSTSLLTVGIPELSTQHEKIIEELRTQFSVITFGQEDPRLRTGQNIFRGHITTHLLLQEGNYRIHVVIFYERAGVGWWHGAISWDKSVDGDVDDIKIDLSELHFGKQPGVYDRIDARKAIVDGQKIQVPKDVTSYFKQLRNSRFVECNRERAAHFQSKYGQQPDDDVITFRQKTRRIIAVARKVFKKLNIDFWLSSGTLLGWYRQCDVIPYSLDVDIGVFIDSYKYDVIDALTAEGLELQHVFGRISDSYELSFRSNSVKLDVFFFYKTGSYIWNGGTDIKTAQKYKYIFPRFSLCWAEFLELKVRVPCPTRFYIEANYGKSWFTPLRHWDWRRSPANVRPNGRWLDTERDDVMQTFHTEVL